MRTAAAYARYSTDKQTENSIAYQLMEIQKYCVEHEILITATYTDEGQSGTNMERPGIRQLMDDAKHRRFECVVIYDISRGSRDVGDWFAFRKQMILLGIDVISASGQKLGDLMDSQTFLMELLTVGMGQAEVLNTRQKSIDGVAVKAKQGVFLGGVPPLGYDVVDGKYVINPVEAETVCKIFDMYADGKSYAKITEACKGTLGKRGRPIGANSLHSILTNERYIGVYTWNKRRVKMMRKWAGGALNPDVIRIEGVIPSIIELDAWNAVQKRLADHARPGRNKATRRDYLLSGMITCGCCGATFVGHTSRNRKGIETASYICGNKYRTRTCKAANINAVKLESFVVDQAKTFLLNQDFRALAEELAEEINANVTDTKPQRRQLAKIERQIQNGVTAILSGADVPELVEKIAHLRASKAALEADIKAAEEKNVKVDVAALYERIKKDATSAANDREAIRRLIKSYVVGITADENGDCVVNIGMEVAHTGCCAPPQPIICATFVLRKGA